MKTRKAWAIPIAALAFAMLFAYGLIATGTAQAQAGGAAPVMGTQIANPDPIAILATAASATSAVAAASFTDADGDTLVFTALTSDIGVGSVEFAVKHVPATATGPIQVWWDALDGATNNVDCDSKKGALGFEVSATSGNTEQVVAPGAPAAATGLCQDFADVTDAQRTMIRQAFHWNMLTGPEMAVAAREGGFTGNYGHLFGDLSDAQRTNVVELFTNKILAMGLLGNLEVENIGISATPPNGKAGTTTITVKASDAGARFLTSAAGQSYQVTANLSPTATIGALTASTFDVPDDSGYSHSLAPADEDGPERIVVRVDADATAILTADVGVNPDPHQQLLNFSLTDGDNLLFRIRKTGLDTAEIVKAPGAALTSVAPYKFTFRVNELTNAPANSKQIEIWVIVVIDNTAPTFAPDTPTTGSVDERANGVTIATFTATDPNNQVLTYSIDAKSGDAGADRVKDGIEIDDATGVLTATMEDAGKVAGDEPDYIELADEDDPATTDIDESMPDNEHVFIVTVSDGTLSTTHEFTLTVEDVVDPARGATLSFTIPENQVGGPAGDDDVPAIGTVKLVNAAGGYRITEQIDGSAVRASGADSLFRIDAATGNLYLKETGSVDFEDAAISNNYLLTVDATDADANIVTVVVEDVNEAPQFSAVDNARTIADGENIAIALYVLESAAVDTVASIGQDAGGNPSSTPAQFVATDEDDSAANPDWSPIAYSLWHDDDGDADTALVPYTGADALVKVDTMGRILVSQLLDTDADTSVNNIALELRASDENVATLSNKLDIVFHIIDTNVAPEFDAPSKAQTHKDLLEDIAVGTTVFTYHATDEDGDIVNYRLRDQDDTAQTPVSYTHLTLPTNREV